MFQTLLRACRALVHTLGWKLNAQIVGAESHLSGHRRHVVTGRSITRSAAVGYHHRIPNDVQLWTPIRGIPSAHILDFVSCHLPTKGDEQVKIVATKEGGYNRVVIIAHGGNKKLVIRIPVFGQEGYWTEPDAFSFRSMALTMRFIRRQTGAPIPDIIAYDETCQNRLGHPYIIMEHIVGQEMENAWIEGADDPTPALEAKRQHMLQSLALNMAKFRTLNFDASGALHFETDFAEPEVGSRFAEEFDENKSLRRTTMKPAFSNSNTYFKALLNDCWTKHGTHGLRTHSAEQLFLQDLINIVFPGPSSTSGQNAHSGAAEKFVLSPPDLDLRNILVDDDGNVVWFT